MECTAYRFRTIRLCGTNSLAALEQSGCVCRNELARHFAIRRGNTLCAVVPAYIKMADGDFSRDWEWAGAAQRAGIPYYPAGVRIPLRPFVVGEFCIRKRLHESK